MPVRYDTYRAAKEGFRSYVEELVERIDARRICEVGGGANPLFPLELIEEKELAYVVLDISAEELGKAPEGYVKVQADVGGDVPPALEPQDLVFSHMLAEHIPDPERFHLNIRAMLREGGLAFHFFPTLYGLPFLINRMLPTRLSERALLRLDPTRRPEGRKAKFPAYYRWCRGPRDRQIERFERLGYAVEEYVGFFGNDYLAKLRPVQRLEDWLAATLVEHPVPLLTNYAYVVLRRVDPLPART